MMREKTVVRPFLIATLGFFFGCNALIGLELGELASERDGGTIACIVETDCNDNNPCTADACEAKVCTYTNDNDAVPNDGEVCTTDTCVDGIQHNTPALGEPCGQDGMLACNDQGKCTGCTTPEQCGATEACQTWKCMDSTCISEPTPPGDFLSDPVAGDCMGRKCDGTSVIPVVEPNLGDLPADDNVDCTETSCAGGVPHHPPSMLGTPCQNGTMVCNAGGDCVPCAGASSGCMTGEICFQEQECVSCTDTAQNGNETDVDCGGQDCPKCADLLECVVNEDCTSGRCEAGLCVSCTDGEINGGETAIDCGGPICGKCSGESCTTAMECANSLCFDNACCNLDCGVPCTSCNLPGRAGQCLPLPPGSEDDNPVCDDTMTCSGVSECVPDNDLGHFGDPCTNNNQCFNNTCDTAGNQTCKLKLGDPCAASSECKSNNCMNNACAN